MKVEIFRRTVKDRRRGNSYDLLYHLKAGIEAAGDEAIIVHEHRTGPTVDGEMVPTAPMAAMFGYGGDRQMHHTKGRRRELANNCRAKKIPLITFDGGLLSSFGNVSTSPDHHFRVSLYTPMNDGDFLSDNSPSDRWEWMVKKFNVKYEPWRRSNPEDPILFGLQPKDNWSMNELDPIDWFKDKKIMKDLSQSTKNAVHIDIGGGEPLIVDITEHFEYLQHFIDSGRAREISLHYNTNGTTFPKSDHIDIWKQFKKVDLQLSIDDTGKRFEYNRWPANWKKLVESEL